MTLMTMTLMTTMTALRRSFPHVLRERFCEMQCVWRMV